MDQEVEDLQKSKKLILDDFSEKDPYEGVPVYKKIVKKYFMLPYAIHPQSKLMILLVFIQVYWWILLKLSHFLAISFNVFFFYEKTSQICVERFSCWVRS